MAVTRRRIAVHGQVIHGSSVGRATPIDASRSSQRSHCASTPSRSASDAGRALVNVPFT
jgi:hypothetical protein